MSSANQGNADAQYNVGLCYYYGDGVKQDYKEAMKWYELAGQKMSLWQKSCCGTVKKLWKRKQLYDECGFYRYVTCLRKNR